MSIHPHRCRVTEVQFRTDICVSSPRYILFFVFIHSTNNFTYKKPPDNGSCSQQQLPIYTSNLCISRDLRGLSFFIETTPTAVATSKKRCYDFKRFRQSSTVVGSKVRGQMIVLGKFGFKPTQTRFEPNRNRVSGFRFGKFLPKPSGLVSCFSLFNFLKWFQTRFKPQTVCTLLIFF